MIGIFTDTKPSHNQRGTKLNHNITFCEVCQYYNYVLSL